MPATKPVLLFLIIFLMSNTGLVFSQVLQIVNDGESVQYYCKDSVAVMPGISISNAEIKGDEEGIKISIADNYVNGEDVLVYKKVADFEYLWDADKGQLEIKGAGTDAEYQTAVSNVFYKNIAEIPTRKQRSFSVSLLDADYLPSTGHFYQYYKETDITWKEAKEAAAGKEYHGLQGYLATIRSQEENDFIWTKVEGVGWIGATDSETEGTTEGKWIWATGPDAGIQFYEGDEDGSAVNGEFEYWNTGEPNNQGNEDYAHINYNAAFLAKSWNDLPNSANPDSEYYKARGYVVEFGDMEDDPDVKLSASAYITVIKIAFSDEREFEICYGESQMLNVDLEDVAPSVYSWTPNENISSSSVPNPVVNPSSTTTYIATGELGTCTDTANFFVQVNPIPESELIDENIICKGESLTLNPGEHDTYEWWNGDTSATVNISEEGIYWVTIGNDNCNVTDTFEVKWSVRPVIDYSRVANMVCGSKTQSLNMSFVSGDASTLLVAFQPDNVTIDKPTSLVPTITVDEYGVYQFEMQMNDEYGCEFRDTLEIEFHNQPVASFSMDSSTCKGYNLELVFDGETVEETMFSWYYNDVLYESGVELDRIIILLGYGEPGRTVGLTVNEQGCTDSLTTSVTVTPDITIVADNNEGCTPLLVNFEARSSEPAETYAWDFGNGNTSDIRNPATSFVNLGFVDSSFDISLTVESTEGCTNTGVISDMITVHPKPTVDFSFSEDDCNPQQMEIWYEGSGYDADTYYWDLTDLKPEEIIKDPGTTNDPLEINRSSEPMATIGIHVVSEFGCASDTLVKTWKRKPVFEIEVDTTEGCPPLEVTAEALVLDEVDVVSFEYSMGDGIIGSGALVEHTFSEPGTNNQISFTGISSVTGCSNTLEYNKDIEVYAVPNAAFTPVPDVVLISDPEIEFTNQTIGATLYEWDFGDMTGISTEENPKHRFSEMGFYSVLLTALNDSACYDTVSHRVAISFDKLYPPSAFSPNAGSEEDREFRIYSEGVVDEGYKLLIFNRWGQVVFESDSQEKGWDGKMKNGNYAPAAVYTWVLQYRDFTNKNHRQKGIITLIF